jgi:hypothetical protein
MYGPHETQHDVTVTLGRGALAYSATIPAGTPVLFLPDPSGGRWVLNAFPADIFPPKSVEKHDAEHYGVTVPPHAVGRSPRRYYQVHERWHCVKVAKNSRSRHGGYAYLVREAAMAHTAMHSWAQLKTWARRRQLSLGADFVGQATPERPYGDGGEVDLTGRYATGSVWSVEELDSIPGERFWALSNGEYTRHVAEWSEPHQMVIVWCCNPNVKDRPIRDYCEASADEVAGH